MMMMMTNNDLQTYRSELHTPERNPFSPEICFNYYEQGYGH